MSIESDSSIHPDDERPSSPIRLVEWKNEGRGCPSEAMEAATLSVRGLSAIRQSGVGREANHWKDCRRRQPVHDSDPRRSPSEMKYVAHYKVWPNVDVHVLIGQVPEHLVVDPTCSVASMNWPWSWSERRMLNLITSLDSRIPEG